MDEDNITITELCRIKQQIIPLVGIYPFDKVKKE